MKNNKLILSLFVLFSGLLTLNASEKLSSELSYMIEKGMTSGKMPGAAVIVIKGGETVFSETFGTQDINSNLPVTPQTLFELGSNTKAFTALALYKLRDQGLVDLEKPVSVYIPGLKFRIFNGMSYQETEVPVKYFLTHSSGLIFESIRNITPDSGDEALKETVDKLKNYTLSFEPGKRHLYATINYDVLGRVIEVVSGKSYEQYLSDEILHPLGLNAYLTRKEAEKEEMSKGHKVFFGSQSVYNAPEYRGNTPAGYLISNMVNMDKWLKILLKEERVPADMQALLDTVDALPHSIQDGENSFYGAGWQFFIKDGKKFVHHGGNNPNFSSYIVYEEQTKTACLIMSNTNTSHTSALAWRIFNYVSGYETEEKPVMDIYAALGEISLYIFCISLFLSLIMVLLSLSLFKSLIKEKRFFTGFKVKQIIGLVISLIILAFFAYVLLSLPFIGFGGIDWAVAVVWAPGSLVLTLATMYFCLFSIISYFVLLSVIRAKKSDTNKQSLDKAV